MVTVKTPYYELIKDGRLYTYKMAYGMREFLNYFNLDSTRCVNENQVEYYVQGTLLTEKMAEEIAAPEEIVNAVKGGGDIFWVMSDLPGKNKLIDINRSRLFPINDEQFVHDELKAYYISWKSKRDA